MNDTAAAMAGAGGAPGAPLGRSGIAFPADPALALMALESKRLKYAFMYDPLLAMSASRVDPLPHQIEAVYGHLLKKPRIRFLLAHDPGAGKTIMAGLLIKELRIRNAVKNILVVVPGQLKEQWRWELKDKFDEDFEVVERLSYNERGSAEVWKGDSIIVSIDFAKRHDIVNSLNGARFDLVIVDEAHKMSAYSSGKSTTKTLRYRLGETLSSISHHLLFLTATPHKGDPANFRLLLDLLEPGYFASEGMMEESVRSGDNPLFLRRAKEDMVDFEGNPLFVPRSVKTPDVQMSRPEKRLYNALSRYVTEQYNMALDTSKGHNITFALMILQRRFASSVYALLESLKRRRAKLAALEQGSESAVRISGSGVDGIADAEEMSESKRWQEEQKWELLSVAQNKEDLRAEIDAVTGLIGMAQKVLEGGSETKLNHLKKTIVELDRGYPDEKILVFTESRDTMEYLTQRIRDMGYEVNNIHGTMPPKARKEAEAVFRDRTRIMVATEAAGEGINLQFCHLMINYDLPWNPNRLEQRMGRVHRYGQKRPVYVFNMVAADTREGEIMQTLFAKLEEIKAAVGSDKVFDVISDIVPGKTLSQMLLDATVKAKTQRRILNDLTGVVSAENRRIRDYLKDGLATKYIDRTALKEERASVMERQLIPEYTRNLFEDVVTAAGGRISERSDGVVSVRTPPQMEHLPDRYDSATFDKRVRMSQPGIDLITLGHPLFDGALEWVDSRHSGAAAEGSVFTDPRGDMDGYVVFYEGAILDGSQSAAAKIMMACFVDAKTLEAREAPAGILLDLEPRGEAGLCNDVDRVEGASAELAERLLRRRMGEVQKDRNLQASSSQKYGLKSIDATLGRIGDEIAALLEKKAEGGKVDLAIYNKRAERRRHRKARRNLYFQISEDSALAPERPKIVGIIRVVPGPDGPANLRRDAIRAAVAFEKNAGRVPKDVHDAGYGFDLRSSNGAQVRHILAKPAPAGGSTVTLTHNEWLRARTLRQTCHLYLVRGGKLKKDIENPGMSLSAVRTPTGYSVDIRG